MLSFLLEIRLFFFLMNLLQFPIHNTNKIIFVMFVCLFIAICTQFYEHLVVFILWKKGILANRTLSLKKCNGWLEINSAHLKNIRPQLENEKDRILSNLTKYDYYVHNVVQWMECWSTRSVVFQIWFRKESYSPFHFKFDVRFWFLFFFI